MRNPAHKPLDERLKCVEWGIYFDNFVVCELGTNESKINQSHDV